MASTAASLMCSGVGKCGSPAPKSTRSAPVERSFSASATTAMVAETWMRLMRSVSILRAGAGLASSFDSILDSVLAPLGRAFFCSPHRFDLAFQALLDEFRPQSADGPAEPVDLFHQ